ncbi:hypothetical protein HRW23_14040 [Streptomyces lunaelactis]|uniref:hypothetical protein n=1 Tax=Streptomyces lunaelactis TaxID=1535768 RepID=UPI001585856C|nr:hypothetical protein [Streptomyces lunaelactis]NUK00313.1 hypothetical protein [Streptomyces lunaelactis]NUK07153.1 hypothetical protein [Streptomyces lunaelactis]NUK14907.1 hypothetical protein [Streptomyces lunaelactis]NUK22101.1 hypothetical protein [Streptomyces lunaelactis]NUK34273.1 hypothetical protein [Streptomyces lunaelactis]
MPAITETPETETPDVVESDTEIAREPGENGAAGDKADQGAGETAEPLGAYAVLLA